MKILLAAISCQRDKDKNRAQRETFLRDLEGRDGVDARFFLGGSADQESDDEVILNCPDGYNGLSEKVGKMFKWAYDQGYDWVFRYDSDCYVNIERLLDAVPIGHDYCGRLRGPSGNWAAPYASGFSYWLSRRAAKIRGEAPVTDTAEDRLTGNLMSQNGIKCLADYRYAVVTSGRNARSGSEGPRVGNDIISACEYTADGMRQVHQEWLTLQAKEGIRKLYTGTPFDDVCVLVKTLLRDKLMYKCVSLIEEHMPGARIVIVDDGLESKDKVAFYSQLRAKGHSCAWLPFDAGFGAKSNEAKKYYDRKYVLIFSDDFEANSEVADGVLKMIKVLEARPDIGVASGRVDGQPYESTVTETERPDGLIDVVLTPADHSPENYQEIDGVRYLECGQTVNYNLVRRDALKRCLWDEEFPIGGDHHQFYEQVKVQGYKVCYVEGANVTQLHRFPGSEDPLYGQARGRARFSLPRVFEKNRWASYTTIDGRVDTPESVRQWVDDHKEKQERFTLKTPTGRIDRSGMRRAKREGRRAKRLAMREKISKPHPDGTPGKRVAVGLKVNKKGGLLKRKQ
jgi:hypothetical protein